MSDDNTATAGKAGAGAAQRLPSEKIVFASLLVLSIGGIAIAAFSRPVHFVRLVAGVAALPVALPIAAVFADWRDAVDFCVTGPYEMVFQRPLGE